MGYSIQHDRLKAAPLGTRAPAFMGGAWCKVANGWKWNGPDGNGGTFPRPGGDWDGRLISAEDWQKR
mgnify:FL=1|jgi:hypothetical protein